MSIQSNLNTVKLDEGCQMKFENKLCQLLELSPSDAGASSNITKTNSGYLGVLQIASSQGKFIVETAARDLDGLIKSLFKLMHKKIDGWRRHRIITS